MTAVTFAVIYRWRLHPDKEAQFREIWERNTRIIARQRGGWGSRLHRGDDGLWLAYAQWPNRAAWERSNGLGSVDPASVPLMREAIIESFPPMPLTPVVDLLVHNADEDVP